jgi:hypothetical protein
MCLRFKNDRAYTERANAMIGQYSFSNTTPPGAVVVLAIVWQAKQVGSIRQILV